MTAAALEDKMDMELKKNGWLDKKMNGGIQDEYGE